MATRSTASLREDLHIRTTLRSHPIALRSTWGLFSPDRIDDGTRLLAEVVAVRPDAQILDLGCGYGALGIALAKDAPRGSLDLVDKDFVAVAYAETNLRENGISNGRAYLSNGFSQVSPDARFDLIVANLPAKVGNELLTILVTDAQTFLAPGGKLAVVTIAGLKEFIKRLFRDVFGNAEKVKQNGTHVVFQAVNPGA